ncbi:TBC1 domain family member 15-like [Saccoglossus kowalevskii]|uniref:TBC1 domain family member 15-like n=1 Tax=Saccoglossus kowalevskii TaxID=10224 RepID=A0ABM0GTG5_SACKO|nr:PREDICTED: TBC1 domain family member 15-like [Saccoglossus kowalevskii]
MHAVEINAMLRNVFKVDDNPYTNLQMKQSKMAAVPLTRTCSWDSSFVQVDLENPSEEDEPVTTCSEDPQFSDKPITLETMGKETFQRLFDSDGRLVDEHLFRKTVFRGGICEEVRKDAWKFLFGLYPCSSTARERETLALENHCRYHALKTIWKKNLSSPQYSYCVDKPDYLTDDSQEQDEVFTNEIESLNSITVGGTRKLSEEVKQQKCFADIQGQVYAGRQSIDMNSGCCAIRIIDKDVPRTDRDHPYFLGDKNPHLSVLRDILITFAVFHPDVGYAQGMNDIVSRFLIVFNSEVDAYWCFIKYMENIHTDFVESGMLRKIKLLRQLLQEVDRPLYRHLNRCCTEDLMFAHRWLMLTFKREFPFEDGLKLFEIISSHYLELTSVEAERERDMERAREFERIEGGRILETEISSANNDFTFELFVCAAILIEERKLILKCDDSASVFTTVNGLMCTMDLATIINRAENVFLSYCRKSAQDCFALVELPQSTVPYVAQNHGYL